MSFIDLAPLYLRMLQRRGLKIPRVAEGGPVILGAVVDTMPDWLDNLRQFDNTDEPGRTARIFNGSNL